MSFLERLREIGRAIRSAKFPPAPKRRHDVIGEAMTRRFGDIGRGAPGDAAAEDDKAPAERR